VLQFARLTIWAQEEKDGGEHRPMHGEARAARAVARRQTGSMGTSTVSICISSIKMPILALDRVQLHLKGAVNSWDYTGMSLNLAAVKIVCYLYLSVIIR
jgi:hypothetical protein